MVQTSIRLLSTVACCAIVAASNGASTTWHYTGKVTPAFQNNLGFPVPVGETALIDITFDPLVSDTNGLAGVGDYLMSGGDTSFRITIGTHASTPITSFRITTIVHGCCASDDQYNFLSYASQGSQMSTSFPGYLEGDVTAQLYFFSRLAPGPITSPDLPIAQPNPAAFENAALSIAKNVTSTNNRLIFHVMLDPIAPVPEPTSALLAVELAALLWSGRSRRG
jgi:hypothetical protein